MYTIQIHGNGLRIWPCRMEGKLFHDLTSGIDPKHYSNCLFDLDKLRRVGLHHWSELAISDAIIAFQLDTRTTIDIKKDRKRIGKFASSELIDTYSLFPQYRIQESSIQKSMDSGYHFWLVEEEIGQIATFRLEVETLLMDDLVFGLIQVGEYQNCVSISYQNQTLISKRQDVLTTRQYYMTWP